MHPPYFLILLTLLAVAEGRRRRNQDRSLSGSRQPEVQPDRKPKVEKHCPQIRCGENEYCSDKVEDIARTCRMHHVPRNLACYSKCIHDRLGQRAASYAVMDLLPSKYKEVVLDYYICKHEFLPKNNSTTVQPDRRCTSHAGFVKCISDAVRKSGCEIVKPGIFL